MTTVGFIGLGRMGSRMAARISGAGFPLTVYNRTRTVAEQFVEKHGGAPAATPGEVARHSEIVITMVADDHAAQNVYLSDEGIVSGIGPDSLAIDMSTISPELSRTLATEVRKAGGSMLDAPVSGSTASAEAGTLMIMVGGDKADLERARPVLSAIGEPIKHVGGNGTGASLKLAINSIVYAINGAVAEALVMAERAGIDRSVAYDAFVNSAIAAPVVKYRREIFERPGELPVTFTVDLAIKDLVLALELAEHVGTTLPQAERNLQVLKEASAASFASDDMASVGQYLRKLASGERARLV